MESNKSNPKVKIDTEGKIGQEVALSQISESQCRKISFVEVGTEEGKIICCSKKAKVQPEVIVSVFRGHYGPVRALQRNPVFSKNFLSIGDWSVVSSSE